MNIFTRVGILSWPGSHEGEHEKRLLNELFHNRGHNKLERPVAVESDPLAVEFGLVLQQIIEVVNNGILQFNDSSIHLNDCVSW